MVSMHRITKRPSRIALLATAAVMTLLLSLTACTAPASEEAGNGDGRDSAAAALPAAAKLEAAVAAALAGTGVPGAAVIITDGAGGESLALYGEARPGASTSNDSIFAYRSITKSFVGTVILQLVEEGRLRLDSPVSEHLDGVPNGDRITIEMLGTMRSGLPNYSAAPGFGELLVEDPSREPDTSELLAVAFAEPRVFEPGTAYEYSNTNTLLLGEVVEAITGDPWTTTVQQRILRPLELESVAYGFPMDEHAAAGFQLADGTVVEELPIVASGWFGAAGGLTGNVRDLAEWGRALGSGSLLDAETQSQRLALLGPTSDDTASPRYDRYGFAMGEIEGWTGHTGNGLGFQSLTMHDVKQGRTIAILLNGTGEDPDLPAGVFEQLLGLF